MMIDEQKVIGLFSSIVMLRLLNKANLPWRNFKSCDHLSPIKLAYSIKTGHHSDDTVGI